MPLDYSARKFLATGSDRHRLLWQRFVERLPNAAPVEDPVPRKCKSRQQDTVRTFQAASLDGRTMCYPV